MSSRLVRLAVAPAVVAAAMTFVSPQTSAQQPDRQAVAIADALTPGDTPGRKFVLRYAEIVRGRIGHLNDLERFLASGKQPVCNLLCEKRVTPGFFRDTTSGPSDLIRYVFGHTCYGVIRDSRHRGTSLRDLNEALGVDIWYNAPGLSDFDKSVIRSVVGDALKDQLGTNNLAAVSPTAQVELGLSKVFALWKQSFVSETQTNVLPRFWPQGMDDAAAEACKDSTFDKSLLTK